MDKRPDSVGLLPQPQKEKVITSQLVEAYLDCPTKCFLRSMGDVATGNAFATWNHTRSEAYYLDGVRRLTADQTHEPGSCSVEPGRWKSEDWLFARSQCVSAKNLATSPHVVQQIPSEGTSKASQLVPIRFVHCNRLSRSNKLMAGFDALVLSKALNIKIGLAKIIYGDHAATFKLRTNTVSREVNKAIGAVAALLSAPDPPNLALNRHCPVCEFRDYCRKRAVEGNDLSLLPNLNLKEEERLNSRGIFTVSQLSYTFRPRRRIRQRAARPEKYHHALKSLAIREQKIHVVGSPQLRVDGTAVLFDVEGNPDRDFYYLIGVQLEAEQGVIHHSFWADSAPDEECIWKDFLNILSHVEDPILVHFGAFETVFLKKMCRRYGGPPSDSAAAKAIASAINLLSVIYAQVYFPTYSNGLKEIARFLGFEWTSSVSSGLQSIIWRHEWEASGDPALRAELITYNADDCKALSLVLRTLDRISKLNFDAPKSVESESDIVHEGSLGKNLASNWTTFKSPLSELEHINRAARWNYQRDRVFVRSGPREKKKQSRENAIKKAASRRSYKKRAGNCGCA